MPPIDRILKHIVELSVAKYRDPAREDRGVYMTSLESVLLASWRPFISTNIPAAVRPALLRGYRHARSCSTPSATAQSVLLHGGHREVSYVEGFTLTDTDELRFTAWLATGNSVVLCATGKSGRLVRKAGLYFVGREIPTELVRSLCKARGAYAPILPMYDSFYGEPIAGRMTDRAI